LLFLKFFVCFFVLLVDDEDLKEQLRINMDRAKDYLDNFKNLNQEIKSFAAQLDLKYDEFGRKNDLGEDSRGRSLVGTLFDTLVKKVRLSSWSKTSLIDN